MFGPQPICTSCCLHRSELGEDGEMGLGKVETAVSENPGESFAKLVGNLLEVSAEPAEPISV